MKFVSIAIDGTSSSGKSTISQELAKKLNFQFISTGYYYRLIAYFVCYHDFAYQNPKEFKKFFHNFKCHFNSKGEILIGNKNYTPLLFEQKVSAMSSQVAKDPQIRKVLTKMQQTLATTQNVVMEGRDIATIVLPRANYKFFITCDLATRAKRRFLQLKEKGQKVDLKTVKIQMKKRDYQDMNREIAPLIKAKDAIVIDTTKATLDKTLAEILSYINPDIGS